MVCGALATALVGLFFNGTAVPMAALMACCSLGGLVILLLGHWRIDYMAKQDELEQQTLEMIEKY